MKKVLLLCLLSVFLMDAQAQNLKFGFSIQPNVGWIQPESIDLESRGTNMGLAINLIGERRIAGSENYWLHTGISISQYGGVLQFDSISYDNPATLAPAVDYTYSIRYLEIPIAFRLKTNEIGMFRYYVMAGLEPGFAVWTSAKVEGSPLAHDRVFVNKEDYDVYDNNDFTDNINVIRMSAIAGVGLEYPISGNTVAFGGFKYDHGFTDILDDKNLTARARYLGLVLGVYF